MEIEDEVTHSALIPSLTEIDELENENEEEESKIVDTLREDIPNYEKALQNLFGKEVANQFVHPKIDESSGVAGMSANLRSHRIMGVIDRKRYKQNAELNLKKIQTNAERLWLMLRENSSCNILKEDSKLDPELKGSFNAFARGYIGRNMTPPQRSFVEDAELTEMRKKMKNKKVQQTELNSRKKHLMFDLSELQEGNQAMLLKEKSFMMAEDAGIRELLFPPIGEDNVVRSAEQEKGNEKRGYHAMLAEMGVDIGNEEALFNKNGRRYMNLRFFSQNDSMEILKEKNRFRDTVSHQLGDGGNVMAQMVAKCRRWSEEDEMRMGERERGMMVARCGPEVGSRRTGTSGDRGAKPWQPLTLGAVMDFKICRKPTFVLDEESKQFRQGACRLWRPRLAHV